MIRNFIYGAIVEPGDEAGFVVTFPDVPEAITEGDTREQALQMAEEALGLGLLSYPERGLTLPVAKAKGRGLVKVAVEPDVAAKLALLEAFRESGLSKSELARRLGKDVKEARRILDPMHPTKLPQIAHALAALGKRLVIGVEQIAA